MKIRQARKIVKNCIGLKVIPKQGTIDKSLTVFCRHNRGREAVATVYLIQMGRSGRKLCLSLAKYSDAMSRASRAMYVYSQMSNEVLSA